MTDKEKAEELVEKAYKDMWDTTKKFRLENFDADEYLLNIVSGRSDENTPKPYNILGVFQNACLEMAAWKEQQMIEKACEWLSNNQLHFILSYKDLEDFKKAMEGE